MQEDSKRNFSKPGKYYTLVGELIFLVFLLFVGLDSFLSGWVILTTIDLVLAGATIFLIVREITSLIKKKNGTL